MYENGNGVPRDIAEAYVWFKLSWEMEDWPKDIRELRDDVEKRLTPEQKNFANQRWTELKKVIEAKIAAKQAGK